MRQDKTQEIVIIIIISIIIKSNKRKGREGKQNTVKEKRTLKQENETKH